MFSWMESIKTHSWSRGPLLPSFTYQSERKRGQNCKNIIYFFQIFCSIIQNTTTNLTFISFLQIYSGSDTQFRDSGLEPKTEYTIRVCGVRVPVPETELAGPYSPPAIFTTLSTDGSGVSGSGNIATTKRVTSSGTNIIQHVSDSFFREIAIYLNIF